METQVIFQTKKFPIMYSKEDLKEKFGGTWTKNMPLICKFSNENSLFFFFEDKCVHYNGKEFEILKKTFDAYYPVLYIRKMPESDLKLFIKMKTTMENFK